MKPFAIYPCLRDAAPTSTTQRQVTLHDVAILQARKGREALQANKFDEARARLARVQATVLDMLDGLALDAHPELCRRLVGIYNYVHRKLVDAWVYRRASDLDDLLNILHIEQKTWQGLAKKENPSREVPIGNPALQPCAGGGTGEGDAVLAGSFAEG